MPALNFKKQFAPLVERGVKKQTIRALRKDGNDPKVGDIVYLYTGMRTKECRKIGEAIVKRVEDCHISESMISIGNGTLNYAEREALAIADGFSCESEFRDFFKRTHGLPFNGKLISW